MHNFKLVLIFNFMTFTNFNSYFILAWDLNAHIGEDPWCTRLHICGDILCNMERRFISLKKGKQIMVEWRMERRFKVLKKGKQITAEWRIERRFFYYFSKKRAAIWFVPNWCLSWFVSNWCSLIEGVINKIYNLLHHELG